jgi:hypothetical protein
MPRRHKRDEPYSIAPRKLNETETTMLSTMADRQTLPKVLANSIDKLQVAYRRSGRETLAIVYKGNVPYFAGTSSRFYRDPDVTEFGEIHALKNALASPKL